MKQLNMVTLNQLPFPANHLAPGELRCENASHVDVATVERAAGFGLMGNLWEPPKSMGTTKFVIYYLCCTYNVVFCFDWVKGCRGDIPLENLDFGIIAPPVGTPWYIYLYIYTVCNIAGWWKICLSGKRLSTSPLGSSRYWRFEGIEDLIGSALRVNRYIQIPYKHIAWHRNPKQHPGQSWGNNSCVKPWGRWWWQAFGPPSPGVTSETAYPPTDHGKSRKCTSHRWFTSWTWWTFPMSWTNSLCASEARTTAFFGAVQAPKSLCEAGALLTVSDSSHSSSKDSQRLSSSSNAASICTLWQPSDPQMAGHVQIMCCINPS